MKSVKIILTAVLLYCLTSYSNSLNKSFKYKKTVNYSTAVDSLQGNWSLVINPKVACSISQVRFFYMDSSSNTLYSHASLIYFSDTIIDRWHELSFNEVNIDTSRKTGEYMVLVSQIDSSISCYKFEPVYYNNKDTFFSITDVWNKRKTLNFRKKQ